MKRVLNKSSDSQDEPQEKKQKLLIRHKRDEILVEKFWDMQTCNFGLCKLQYAKFL